MMHAKHQNCLPWGIFNIPWPHPRLLLYDSWNVPTNRWLATIFFRSAVSCKLWLSGHSWTECQISRDAMIRINVFQKTACSCQCFRGLYEKEKKNHQQKTGFLIPLFHRNFGCQRSILIAGWCRGAFFGKFVISLARNHEALHRASNSNNDAPVPS
jgi:hypothetical protein